jgi:hypothetical protein
MDPSQPCPNGTCHFLRLSAELRNMVYGYTLTNPNGILCREDSYDGLGIFRFYAAPVIERRPSINVRENEWYAAQLEKSLKTATEVDQLKYVCRQLNHETKNFLLCANKLVFAKGPRDLLSFLEALPKTLHGCLRGVTVWEHRDLSEEDFFQDRWWCIIAGNCMKQDAFTVQMIWPLLLEGTHPNWLGAELSIICRIAIFAVCARKDPTFVKKLIYANKDWREDLTRIVHLAQVRVSSKQASMQQASFLSDKIRIFPSHEKLPDHNSLHSFDLFWLPKEEEIDCIATVKEVFENGI